MNKQTEALKMAIKLMEEENLDLTDAYQVCKEALEQEQSFAEKTAQMSFMSLWDAYTTLKMKLEALEQPASKNIRESFNEMLEDKVAYYKGKQPAQEPVPLIRHENGNFSPAPSWQGLSDDDMEKAKFYDESFYNGARWAEQALKEKNHG